MYEVWICSMNFILARIFKIEIQHLLFFQCIISLCGDCLFCLVVPGFGCFLSIIINGLRQASKKKGKEKRATELYRLLLLCLVSIIMNKLWLFFIHLRLASKIQENKMPIAMVSPDHSYAQITSVEFYIHDMACIQLKLFVFKLALRTDLSHSAAIGYTRVEIFFGIFTLVITESLCISVYKYEWVRLQLK
ncbi:hypothetical protein BY458DRAFT_489366 [Sporodiniella umbellata]|nr:hypothetical protein BY458DRAFT_489366 [Sporodiniella umbellata]